MEEEAPQSKWNLIKKRGELPLQLFILVSIVSLAQYVLWRFILSYHPIGENYPSITFADSFVPISTLFSGLAFAGVIWAILLQRAELQLQRTDLRLTRAELERSADAHREHVALVTADHNRRLHDEQRRVTFFCKPIKGVFIGRRQSDHEMFRSYKIKMVNDGETIFAPSVESHEEGHGYVGKSVRAPARVKAGEDFELVIEGAEPKTSRHEIKFWLKYYDLTGSLRKQEYQLTSSVGDPRVECINHGFPENAPPS